MAPLINMNMWSVRLHQTQEEDEEEENEEE